MSPPWIGPHEPDAPHLRELEDEPDLQRGGGPNAYDRLLALRFEAAAVRMVQDRQFGTMVALVPPRVHAVPLEEAVSHIKTVPLDSDVIQTARSLGICLGDR